MTRSDRSFPVGPRLLALSVALAAVLLSVPGAGAQTGPSAGQVDSAHQAFLAAQEDIRAYQAQIASVQTELAAAAERLEREEGALDQLIVQISETRARIAEAQSRYDRIRARLNERAAQAFMSGPGSDLEVVLGATSLDDLSDRLEYVDSIARSDATLAQQVANLAYALQIEEQTLEELKAQQHDKVVELRSLRDEILQKLSYVNQLRNQAAARAEQTLSQWQHLRDQRADYLKELAARPPPSSGTSSPHTAVALPPGFRNPLEVCPVGAPRAFGDGFGAPRYAGGFHLHAGVDVLANYGTPIYAPFDGIAKRSYNTLGGNSEYVYGASGYVYNAHLDHYAPKSSGPVQAGDIIGYVGDTGDAAGTPHDHFEWHPDVVPSNWPASFYGYTVVGSAVNPYPLLYDVCG